MVCQSSFHQNTRLFYQRTEKANGIIHEYAWLDKHPEVCSMVTK